MLHFPPFQEGIFQFFEILGHLASVTLAIAACIGLAAYKHWRDEYAGKRKFELALTILTLAEQIRDGFTNSRNVFMLGSKRLEKTTEPLNEIMVAYQERQAKMTPLVNDFYKAKIEGEIIFGTEIGKEMTSLIRIYNDYINMTSSYFYEMNFRPGDMNPTDNFREAEKYVFAKGIGKDEFSEEIDQLCKSLHVHLKPFIEFI